VSEKLRKTTNKEDYMWVRVWKADVPKNTLELNSEIQENYKVEAKGTDKKEGLRHDGWFKRHLTTKFSIIMKLQKSQLRLAFKHHLWINKESSHVV
jgi:hypothetical protein